MGLIISYIIMVIVVSLYIYFGYLLINRVIKDKKYDKEFNISTRGLRNWDKNGLYNRTESTPYLALSGLVKEYKFNKNDRLVDFGSGKGRVSIYIHNKCQIPVVGVELNELTYDEAVLNINNYLNKHGNINVDLKVERAYAEKYKIGTTENKFFFFNPFNVIIFKEVVNNIIDNAVKNNKSVDIILYYPMSKYKDYLQSETPFKLHKEIRPKGAVFPKERFLIYRFTP